MIILGKWLNCLIWLLDGTLTGSTILGHSGHGSNGSKGVLSIPHCSRTGASTSNDLVSYPWHIHLYIYIYIYMCVCVFVSVITQSVFTGMNSVHCLSSLKKKKLRYCFMQYPYLNLSWYSSYIKIWAGIHHI